MAEPRRDHTATLLRDGNVLIVGWFSQRAELYNPSTGTFLDIGETVYNHGQHATATPLRDGSVLIVGGNGAPFSAEIYDPLARTFKPAPDPRFRHTAHTATPLRDGRILLAGGQDLGPLSHAHAEVYDPAAGAFTPTGELNEDRAGHSATMLADGTVLIAGGTQSTSPGLGFCLDSAEIYDPATGSFAPTGSLVQPRCDLGISGSPRLANGRVLVVGSSITAELYDPITGTFTLTGSMSVDRLAPSATLLEDGRVLVAGGVSTDTAGGPVTLATSELFDPGTGAFEVTGTMKAERQQHTATRLPDGRVLVTGGYSFALDANVSSAELYSFQAGRGRP